MTNRSHENDHPKSYLFPLQTATLNQILKDSNNRLPPLPKNESASSDAFRQGTFSNIPYNYTNSIPVVS
jgi:hypothetical protein